MKLELKHLAPYLPYGLHGKYRLSEVINLQSEQKDEIRKKLLTTDSATFFLKYCKPILRPLSSLTKEIEHNGEKFVPAEYWDEIGLTTSDAYIIEDAGENIEWINGLSWKAIQKLFEWHFDVFNLIENGLALDYNVIK